MDPGVESLKNKCIYQVTAYFLTLMHGLMSGQIKGGVTLPNKEDAGNINSHIWLK